MATSRSAATEAASTNEAETLNEVSLRGRITAAPQEREMPSGDALVTFRLSVRRGVTPLARGSRQTADWVDCVAAAARVRRAAAAWTVGDEVEVLGVLRRRFFRTAGGGGSRLEVEALQARRTQKAQVRPRPE